ncbi:MAG TPA: carboxypeptidase-like regulatory domain-containing protein [Pyrinomonadaceae bacterium]|nr:carboxypeptidase-like regulatory domain-containing protein [Pyrinomonadaceae bacterium]
MKLFKLLLVCAGSAALLSLACGGVGRLGSEPASNTTANANAPRASATPAGSSGAAEPVTGVEKVKPAPGTGNVQGKVLYNGRPVEGIEVKLCEKFNQFFGGCSGKTHTAKSDADGDYVVKDVPPATYEGLMARVFDTDSYIFATTGVAGLTSAKYDVKADQTLFVRPTHLFKSDLKLLSPKAGSKVSAGGLELKWQEYPEAAYYKLSLYPSDSSITSPYIGQRVEATTFPADKPLPKGEYRVQLEAYNASDQKLAESARDIKFTVTE